MDTNRGPIIGCDGNPVPGKREYRELETKSPSRLPLPSPFLLGLRERLLFARRQFSIEKETLEPWPPVVTQVSISSDT